jgi:hypothetical protein
MEECEGYGTCRKGTERNQGKQVILPISYMENTPSKMITEAASIAIDAIESQVDTKIWRTRLRIQELIVLNNPYLKKNPFITDQKLFLYLILSFVFSGSITTLKGNEIVDS